MPFLRILFVPDWEYYGVDRVGQSLDNDDLIVDQRGISNRWLMNEESDQNLLFNNHQS